MIYNLILLHKLCCVFWRQKTYVFADQMHVQTVPRYTLLKNVWEHELGRVSAVEGCRVPCLGRGHKLFRATYSRVTLALTLTPCTKPSAGQRNAEHSCLNTHKKEHQPAGTGDTRRWSERLAEATCGWRCAPGRRGSMPSPLRDCSYPHQGKDT